ncbi:MAG: hypothetical protein IRZ31_19525 [Thermogemmatispora sp.]|uniref:hypothetical protein n=1 Tax=Thermogemmatispora sp. TaxID=1968838 RepID=UPI002633CAF6|nr:hypothetical protein [Thermogemmatispora sp.]MBX5459089.1 hypothetical protein [Thermogemmatispora sp.]
MNDSPGRPSGLFSTPTTVHSLDQFRQTLNHYLAVIGQQQEVLLSEYIALRGQARLRLDQRQRQHLQRLLSQYQEQLLSFRGLLEQPQALPDEVVPLRYLPLLFSQNAESQTRHLLDLLTALPSVEQERAPARQRRQQQQQALLQSWEQLLHYYEELAFHTRALSDQTRFLLRRLSLERREMAPSQESHGDRQPASAQPDEAPVAVLPGKQAVQADTEVEKR